MFEYKNVTVNWTGSNGESTSVVQDVFAVSKRGTTDSTFLLRDATLHALWNPLEVENLTAGQSSSGYTSSDVLAAGANNKNYKKVCTITCAAANAPAWEWSDDFTACTATFTDGRWEDDMYDSWKVKYWAEPIQYAIPSEFSGRVRIGGI